MHECRSPGEFADFSTHGPRLAPNARSSGAPQHRAPRKRAMHGVHVWNASIRHAHNPVAEQPAAVQSRRAQEFPPRLATLREPA
jgi:hypothetical protein